MSDSEEEEISVNRFKHEEVDYLKDANNILYDPKTSEAVGYWNAETKEVEELAEFGSDEESDEESEDSDEEEEPVVRPIYGLIETNPQYSKEEIEEMFAESDNVSYYDK